MHIPLLCLLGFVAWTLVLVTVGVAGVRVSSILAGTAPVNGFPGDEPHGRPRYRRTMRAHLNCVENLPLFAAVVLTGAVVHAGSARMDLLTLGYLGARIVQSLAHIASGSAAAISLRFTCFVAQLVCLTWMGVLVGQAIEANHWV